jgi:hypothetical protein
MKKILFLLLISKCISGNIIDRIEHAIMSSKPIENLEYAITKSDLKTVKQVLDGDMAISLHEQLALIVLATEIIKKRENKIIINAFRPANSKAFKLRSMRDFMEFEKFEMKKAALFLLSLTTFVGGSISCLIGKKASTGIGSKIGLGVGIILLITSAKAFVEVINKCHEYDLFVDEVMEELNRHYKTKYNDAIQIRQLLYTIKPGAI